MRKRARLHVRWPEADAEIVIGVAQGLDLSLSEFVRRAAVSVAMGVLQGEPVPPPTPGTGQADRRSLAMLGS